MPYIGNTAGNRFVASQAATRFSGNGSNKVFTLDHSVGSDEDILVSVDGVIQEPSISYVVSNGTTLTFQGTDAPSNGTNNIFVCYLFRTVATVGHPSTSALSATSGTFSGAITGGGTFTPGGNIVIPDAGNIGSASDTDAMAISSGGVVTFTQNTVGAGGMDLILSSTLTSSLGNIDISSTYINSTYDEYFLTFNLNPDEDNRHLYLQVFVGGSAQGGSIYANEAQHIGGNSNTLNSDTATLFRFNSKGIGYESGEGISGQLLFQNVNDTDHPFCYSGFVNFYDTSGDMTSDVCGGGLIPANRASVVNGLRFYMSGGQATGDFKLYGLRK